MAIADPQIRSPAAHLVKGAKLGVMKPMNCPAFRRLVARVDMAKLGQATLYNQGHW